LAAASIIFLVAFLFLRFNSNEPNKLAETPKPQNPKTPHFLVSARGINTRNSELTTQLLILNMNTKEQEHATKPEEDDDDDDSGVPTTDASGKPLSKAQKKKLKAKMKADEEKK